MLRATIVVRKPAVRADRVVDTVTLDREGRQGRHVALTSDNGLAFLLDLDRATTLGHGDAVRLEDGRLVQVLAAPERLLEVRAENPARLLRAAYQMGSRHALVEVTADAVYVEDDPALAELVRGHGCKATPVMRPFEPERAADEHDCGHDHGHAHGHHHHAHGHHDHAHDRGHGHEHRGHADHAHDHGHHAHDHDHDAHQHTHGDRDHHHTHDHDHSHHAHAHGAGCGCGHDHKHEH